MGILRPDFNFEVEGTRALEPDKGKEACTHSFFSVNDFTSKKSYLPPSSVYMSNPSSCVVLNSNEMDALTHACHFGYRA